MILITSEFQSKNSIIGKDINQNIWKLANGYSLNVKNSSNRNGI